MRKIVFVLIGTVMVIAAGFAVAAVAALPRSTILAQCYPELADLAATKDVLIGIQWYGLSDFSPMIANYALTLRDDQFSGRGHFKIAEALPVNRPITVPRDVMRSFLTIVSKVPMVEGEYKPRIEHTDDYPSLEFGIATKDGELRIGTESQYVPAASGTGYDRTPWHINYRDRSFVVTASDLDRAYEPFDRYLRDDEIFKELRDDIMNSGGPHGR